LKPWLPEAGISMVFAPPGVGKTYLCLSIAKAISNGGKLFDWLAPEQRCVLYVDGEMHESDLQSRIIKLTTNETIPNTYLHYMNGSWQPDLFLPDLSNRNGQKLIDEVINFHKIQVLILDNLSTLCRSGKENETDSWKEMQNWLLRLRMRGITTILVHHASKAKDTSGKPVQRGTSMREVILDSSIALSHSEDYTEEQGCVFELKYTKARGFWGADAAPLEAKLIEKNGIFFWEHKPLSIKNHDRVIEAYNNGETSPTEIAKLLGLTRQAVQGHINRAKADGDIR
jgi:putative DNA primase/helicase